MGGDPGERVRARRARRALALACLLFATGCAASDDTGRSVENRLSRLDGVASARVATHGSDVTARITLDAAVDAAVVATVVDAVGNELAAHAPYALTLVRSPAQHDTLRTDDRFPGSRSEVATITRWLAVTRALSGVVTLRRGSGRDRIGVDSDAAVAHDISEAARLPAARPADWTFRGDRLAYTAVGRVTAGDVGRLRRAQQLLGSPSLATPPAAWEVTRGRARLFVSVSLPVPEGVRPAAFTAADFGADYEALAAILDRVSDGWSGHLWVQWVVADRGDVLAVYNSLDAVPPGRDPAARGWDRWLARHLTPR